MQGILNGIMIEGGARWGYDPVWYDKNIGRRNNPRGDLVLTGRDTEDDDARDDGKAETLLVIIA